MEKSEILTVEKKESGGRAVGWNSSEKISIFGWPDFYWNFLEFMCFSMRSGCVVLLCFALLVSDEEGLCSIFLEILEKFHASSSSG